MYFLISGVKAFPIARVLPLLINFSCIYEDQSWWVRITTTCNLALEKSLMSPCVEGIRLACDRCFYESRFGNTIQPRFYTLPPDYGDKPICNDIIRRWIQFLQSPKTTSWKPAMASRLPLEQLCHQLGIWRPPDSDIPQYYVIWLFCSMWRMLKIIILEVFVPPPNRVGYVFVSICLYDY